MRQRRSFARSFKLKAAGQPDTYLQFVCAKKGVGKGKLLAFTKEAT